MYAIMTVLRLGSEEGSGRAELQLPAPVDRGRWALGHLVFASAAPGVLQLILELSFGLGTGELGGTLTTALSLAPAVWVMVGIAMAAVGLTGRGAGVVAWGALIVALVVESGQHLGWPEWLFLAFSPFAPMLPFAGPPGVPTLSAVGAHADRRAARRGRPGRGAAPGPARLRRQPPPRPPRPVAEGRGGGVADPRRVAAGGRGVPAAGPASAPAAPCPTRAEAAWPSAPCPGGTAG